MARPSRVIGSALGMLLGIVPAAAPAVEGNLVLSHVKLDDTSLGGALVAGSQFGIDVTGIGDVNGDGVDDIAVGARQGDDGGIDRGSFWLIFLDANGAAVAPSPLRISDTMNDPLGELTLESASGSNLGSQFGDGLAWLPDFDGDAIAELKLAVGASGADPGAAPEDSGAIYLVDIDVASWTISDVVTIASGAPGFTTLDAEDRFGISVNAVGDWDGDGAPELVAGAPFDDDGATDHGAFYVLYLKPDGTGVKTYAKLSDTQGGFDGVLDANPGLLGNDVTPIGDLDGDEQVDLVAGASQEGAGGAVFTIFMNPGCATSTLTVPHPSCVAKPGAVKIGQGLGGFGGSLPSGARFGGSVAWIEDASGFAPDRLVVGAFGASSERGEAWILTLAPDGGVGSEERIASGVNWSATLPSGVNFGVAANPAGDWNGDGVTDLIVGAWLDDTGGTNTGAAYLLALDPCSTVVTAPSVFLAPNDDGVNPCVPLEIPSDTTSTLHLYLETGPDLSSVPGDVCATETATGDELCAWDVRVAVEAPRSILAFTPNPLLAADLRMNGPPWPPNELRVNWVSPATPTNPAAGPIKIGDLVVTGYQPSAVRVAPGSAAVGARLQLLTVQEKVLAMPEPEAGLGLGASLALLTLLARRRARSRPGARTLSSLLLLAALATAPHAAGAATSVKGTIPIATGVNGLGASFVVYEFFASSVVSLGDLDGDGTPDLAVGSEQIGALIGPGHVYILFMTENATVAGWSVIDGPATNSQFGSAIANLGDLDGDGVVDLAVGAKEDYSGGRGSVTILFLNRDGTEKSRVLLDETTPGLSGISSSVLFGRSIAHLGDLDGNGTVEIVVGAPRANVPTSDSGEIWLLSLNPNGSLAAASQWTKNSGLPGAIPIQGSDLFGFSVAAVGDLDGPGGSEFAIAVGSPGDADGGSSSSAWRGSFYLLYLDVLAPGQIAVQSYVKHSSSVGNLPFTLQDGDRLGAALAFAPAPAGGSGGVLYVGSGMDGLVLGHAEVWPVRLAPDGTILQGYTLSASSGVGFTPPATNSCSWTTTDNFGRALAVLPDADGDETPDLAVGAPVAMLGTNCDFGVLYLLRMQDTDHDGLDDNLDNCVNAHNPLQDDLDDDGAGDLCDNCVDVPNANQADADADGEGNDCEPVELVLQTTGTPAAPSWDVSLQCGAYSVTEVAGAIVLPAGASSPKLLSLSGASVGGSAISGPGLATPAGVRSDAIYFQATGNGAPDGRLCTALQAPVSLGTLTTGAISGTQLAAAALSAEGVGTPGFGLALAKIAGNVAVPLSRIRFVNGIPLPILDLELGPAVQTASGTRWEVRAVRASDEFHRVAFGLIAPAGTTTSQMRWRGCNTASNGSGERTCCESPPCDDFDALGIGSNVNPNRSWTVGPQATPPGTQLPHTLYVVLEGSAVSSSLSATVDTLNPADEGTPVVVLGEVELTGSPDLEPALTLDGVNDIDDLFSAGKVVPLEDVTEAPRNVEQVKLIGAFNPADDLDGDGIQDLGDNCPFIDNTAQTNRGAFLDATDDSDAFGDACQCAESTNDGAVLDPGDFEQIRDYLAGLVTNPVIAAEIASRCSVAGPPDCNIRDLVYLKLALDTAAPAVEPRCDAALSPAQGP